MSYAVVVVPLSPRVHCLSNLYSGPWWFTFLLVFVLDLANDIPTSLSLLCNDAQRLAYLCEDSTAALLHSLRAAQIDDSIERISSSSAVTRETKQYASSADSNRGHIHDVYSSPSKSASIGNFTLPSANSSPSAERHQRIMESPSWRREDSFVRHVQAQVEDPFVSSGTNHASSAGKRFFSPILW